MAGIYLKYQTLIRCILGLVCDKRMRANMKNDMVIKITSITVFALFVTVFIIDLFMIGCGYVVGGGLFDLLESSVDMAEPDNPGSGWLVLGGIIGSIAGGFVGAVVMTFGIGCILADVLTYIPAFVGYMIWRKKHNARAYWICMMIWLCLIVICVICLLVF